MHTHAHTHTHTCKKGCEDAVSEFIEGNLLVVAALGISFLVGEVRVASVQAYRDRILSVQLSMGCIRMYRHNYSYRTNMMYVNAVLPCHISCILGLHVNMAIALILRRVLASLEWPARPMPILFPPSACGDVDGSLSTLLY